LCYTFSLAPLFILLTALATRPASGVDEYLVFVSIGFRVHKDPINSEDAQGAHI